MQFLIVTLVSGKVVDAAPLCTSSIDEIRIKKDELPNRLNGAEQKRTILFMPQG